MEALALTQEVSVVRENMSKDRHRTEYRTRSHLITQNLNLTSEVWPTGSSEAALDPIFELFEPFFCNRMFFCW